MTIKVASDLSSANRASKLVSHYVDLVPPSSLSISTLRNAIPPHCFERSLLKSSGYLLFSLSLCYLCHVVGWGLWYGQWLVPLHLFFGNNTGGLSNLIADNPVFRAFLGSLFFITYACVQGTIAVGLWIIAHECGHHAFSKYERLNDFIGWICHSILQIPYFAWQHSHSQHHRYTANLQRDVVYIPKIQPSSSAMSEDDHSPAEELLTHFEESGVGAVPLFFAVVQLLKMFIIGWPTYLWAGYTGPAIWRETALKNPYDRLFGKISHYRSDSPVFEALGSEVARKRCVYGSNLGLALVWMSLGLMAWETSVLDVCRYYFGPLMIVNSWLILITYLHHTDFTIPHYSHPTNEQDLNSWTYVRGALATMDRGSYGYIIDTLHHHIGSTHVVHHLFSKIPHYHAQEATAAVRQVLGKYYRHDAVISSAASPPALCLDKLFRDLILTKHNCQLLRGEGPVHFFFPSSK